MPGRAVKILLLTSAAVAGAAIWSIVRPSHRTVEGSFLHGAEVTPEVREVLIRACADCHSEATAYPWYSVLPYVSRVIEDDVRRGRDHLNLSKWHEYPRLRQQRALTGIASQVKDRLMPLPEYVRLHPSARLSDDEVNAVFEWAGKERLRLILSAAR